MRELATYTPIFFNKTPQKHILIEDAAIKKMFKLKLLPRTSILFKCNSLRIAQTNDCSHMHAILDRRDLLETEGTKLIMALADNKIKCFNYHQNHFAQTF